MPVQAMKYQQAPVTSDNPEITLFLELKDLIYEGREPYSSIAAKVYDIFAKKDGEDPEATIKWAENTVAVKLTRYGDLKEIKEELTRFSEDEWADYIASSKECVYYCEECIHDPGNRGCSNYIPKTVIEFIVLPRD